MTPSNNWIVVRPTCETIISLTYKIAYTQIYVSTDITLSERRPGPPPKTDDMWMELNSKLK